MLKIFTDFSIEGIENIRNVKKPVILVANHESTLDPPLIGVMALYNPRLFPIRFMAKNQLFWYPVFNLLIFLLGAFKANKKQGIDNSLRTPLRILKHRGTLMMFPEGHIMPERGKLGLPRKGTSILGIMTDAAILPMSLHTPFNLHPLKLIFGRPKIAIRVGPSIYFDNINFPDVADATIAKANQLVIENIGKLYARHKY